MPQPWQATAATLRIHTEGDGHNPQQATLDAGHFTPTELNGGAAIGGGVAGAAAAGATAETPATPQSLVAAARLAATAQHAPAHHALAQQAP